LENGVQSEVTQSYLNYVRSVKARFVKFWVCNLVLGVDPIVTVFIASKIRQTCIRVPEHMLILVQISAIKRIDYVDSIP
jgi:hypothetical protein